MSDTADAATAAEPSVDAQPLPPPTDGTGTAPTTGVSIVENPHTDPVTVAWSALDAAMQRDHELSDELDRMKDKLARAQADVAAAETLVADAVTARDQRLADIEAAKTDLAAAQAANPDLAAEVQTRRDTERSRRIEQLKAELALLGGGS